MKAEHTQTGKKSAPRIKARWHAKRPAMAREDWLRVIALAAALFALTWIGTAVRRATQPQKTASNVVISRVMTSNPSVCYAVDGLYYDWLELTNTSALPVSLKGWRLTDDADLRGGFVFGDINLAGRESMIVYCADKPSGYSGEELFTGFRLSSDGELLVLSEDGQELTQVLDVPAMGAAEVYQRENDGNYSTVSYYDLLAGGDGEVSLDQHAGSGLLITELMAANRTTLADEDGDYSDWIELCNSGPVPVELGGCALTDTVTNRRKWVLPSLTLQPGERKIVFASGKDRGTADGAWHTSFRLKAHGESVWLYDAHGALLSYMRYDQLTADASLSRLDDGSVTTELMPSPGWPNTAAGSASALDNLTIMGYNSYGLYINEILAAGSSARWVEVYNAGDAAIDLSGMGLSDNIDKPRKWQFPDGASVAPGGYALVGLSGAKAPGAYTADFGLKPGETLCLSLRDGEVIDHVRLMSRQQDISYGRAEGTGRYRYFKTPTPGMANAGESYARQAVQVTFSAPGGLQNAASVRLELSSEPGTRIYYTTDGSTPTQYSHVYSTPLELSTNTVVKAIAAGEDMLPSWPCASSYIFGESHGVRVVAVSGDAATLTGDEGMLNTGIKGNGCDAYVEIYEPNGSLAISQGCLLKLSGHSSRVQFPQKAFALKAEYAYGDNRFRYPLFSGRDYGEYKSITLRASGQDCEQTHMRDSILTTLAENTTVMYQETEVAVVYVNGQYWGVYNMRERVSPRSVAQFEGWDNSNDFHIVEGDGTNSKAFSRILTWLEQNDLTDDANVQFLRKGIDIENYLDYVAIQMFICNQDLGNVRIYRNLAGDGVWRWILFDTDLSFQIDRDNVTDWLNGDGVGTITQQDNTLFKHLMKNAGLRDYFLTRMGELLATSFSTESLLAKIETRYNLLLPEMEANCQRWSWSVGTWKKFGARMVKYANTRPGKMISYLKEDFRLTDAQVQQYFGAALEKIAK